MPGRITPPGICLLLLTETCGHSLQAGHITQAALNGAPTWAIMEQSRHKSERVFRSYIRKVERFEHNSSKQLGL